MNKNSLYLLGVFVSCLIPFIGAANTIIPIISITGKGEIKLEPQEAVIKVGVELRSRNLEQVREDTDTRAAAVIAFLRSQGIEDKDIQTSYMSLTPSYPYKDFNPEEENNNVEPDYYEATKTMTFILRNLDEYDRIMVGLYAAGINRVDDITFRVPDTKSQEAEAKKLAITEARRVANLLVAEFGARLGQVYSIGKKVEQERPIFVQEEAQDGIQAGAVGFSMASSPSIAGGEVDITSEVNVKFYIDQ